LRRPDQLKSNEQRALRERLDGDAELAAGYRLLQRFREVSAQRQVSALDTWLQDAHASTLAPFVGPANGIVKDGAAVDAALTMRWSTSMVEGHVNRVKLIKRQGYGRSSFALLRRRIMAA
jgi:transposase